MVASLKLKDNIWREKEEILQQVSQVGQLSFYAYFFVIVEVERERAREIIHWLMIFFCRIC